MFRKLIAILAIAALMIAPMALAEGRTELVMGTNPEFPPFEFVASDGSVDGIDAAIAAEIAKDLGVELRIEAMEFDALLVALAVGQIDFVAAGMTVREDRKENADFTDTYFIATQVIIVLKDNPAVAGPDDLFGKKIGVQMGTTGDFYASDFQDDEDPTVEIFRYSKAIDAVMDLKNGAIDCVIIDAQPAASFASMNEDIMVLPDMLTEEEYAIAVQKGDTELLEAINATLKRIMEDGTYDAICEKYLINEDIDFLEEDLVLSDAG